MHACEVCGGFRGLREVERSLGLFALDLRAIWARVVVSCWSGSALLAQLHVFSGVLERATRLRVVLLCV